MALTNKQRVFIDHYLQSWNATAAALAAGYSERSAYSIGPENLKKPEIAAEIERRLVEVKMSADEALVRTAEIARGNLAEWVDEDGAFNIAALKASGKGGLLKKYKHSRRVTTTKEGDEFEATTVEVELYPADAAQDRILRAGGVYVERREHVGEVKIRVIYGDGTDGQSPPTAR